MKSFYSRGWGNFPIERFFFFFPERIYKTIYYSRGSQKKGELSAPNNFQRESNKKDLISIAERF